ncbi:MAG: dTDP-4-dehydrorhamnose reductase [Leptospirillia bacterium]
MMSPLATKTLTIGLIGSRGQLGSDLLARVPRGQDPALEITPLDRPEFDLTHPQALSRIREAGFDLVINTSAYNAVDRAEEEIRECFELNAFLPGELARACREAGSALLHFSTDYVMSGGLNEREQIPYSEESCPRPLSVYGLSKATGERLVLSAWERATVVRTCGLYGGKGSGQKGGNFVTTMLKLARAGRPLRVIDDCHVGPTSTWDLAEILWRLILERHPPGLYHLTNAGRTTWYDFAKKIFALTGTEADLSPVSLREYNPPAPRAPYSVLSNDKARQQGLSLRDIDSALEDYLLREGLLGDQA